MRLTVLFGILMFAAASVFAQENQKYVSPKKDETGVYKNEVRKLYEEPLVKVGPNDRLLVTKSTGRSYQVQMQDGTLGWVDKDAVVATGKSKTFVFDNAEVLGYLDNPTPVYIMDADDPNANPISLDRSFKDALKENVDRETVERQTK